MCPRVFGVFHSHVNENSIYIHTCMYILYTYYIHTCMHMVYGIYIYYIHTCMYIYRVLQGFSECFILTYMKTLYIYTHFCI